MTIGANRLIVCLSSMVPASLAVLQWVDIQEPWQPISFDLNERKPVAWILAVLLVGILITLLVQDLRSRSKVSATLMCLAFMSMLGTLLITPTDNRHDAAVVILAVTVTTWLYLRAMAQRVVGIIRASIALLCVFPIVSYVAYFEPNVLGILEKLLILTFLIALNRLMKAGSEPAPSTPIKPQRMAAGCAAIILSISLSLAAAAKGSHDYTYSRGAHEFDREGSMTLSDGYRYMHVWEELDSRPSTESDLVFLRRIATHPTKPGEDAAGMAQFRVTLVLRSIRRTDPRCAEVCDIATPILRSNLSWARGSAIELLGRLEGVEAIPVITPMVEDKDPDVRKTAKRVLQKLRAGQAVVKD